MDKKFKKLNEKELGLIELLKKTNRYENISTKDYVDNFIRIKNTKKLGNIIYCIQVPDPKFKDICSVAAFFPNDEGNYSQVGKITFAVKDFSKKQIYIDRIYVAPEFNHQGIGSSLLEIFEDVCISELGDKVSVSGVILPDNDDEKSLTGVCNFYKKKGYNVGYSHKTALMLNKTLKKKFSLFKSNSTELIDLRERT